MYAWCCFNGLAINPNKSEAVLFRSCLCSFPLPSNIDLAGTAVPLSDTVNTNLINNNLLDPLNLPKMVMNNIDQEICSVINYIFTDASRLLEALHRAEAILTNITVEVPQVIKISEISQI